MKRNLIKEIIKKTEETVYLSGWVNARRDHGGVIFVDLRDHTGIAQLVLDPAKLPDSEKLRDEFVISASGKVRERGEGLKNPNLETGEIEVVVEKLVILNESEPLPIAEDSNEELRLKYRYLDLRRQKMQETLRERAKYYATIREFMAKNEFTEIATPILANSSPEGARDFLVPSRLHEGKFYALPQAPQQFKQLLMVGGFDKYYQIATCFRDEDPRADRLYGDFYQLDCEMAFVDDGEIVRKTVEPLIKELVKKHSVAKMNEEIPRISYADAMETYGTDKPDLRYEMKLVDLNEALKNTEFGVFKNAECVKAIAVSGGAELSRKQIDNFTEIAKKAGAGGLAYLTYKDGEIQSPIAKFLTKNELSEITKLTGAKDGYAVFFGADNRKTVNKVLGELRISFAEHFNLADENKISLCWIVDFPFYEYDEIHKKVDFGHNPFSMPKGGLDALKTAETDEEKLAILADQYDMVMNGYEICSGAVRNHHPEIMYGVFEKLGYSREYTEEKFGAMLTAFKYGAPPHAGCAFGLDRIFMVLRGEKNIREVVAFPKNGTGIDLMMNSPAEVMPEQLKELGL